MATVNDTNPDDLMSHFRGRSLKSILIFTLFVHIVVIGGTSIPYLIKKFSGAETAKMTDDERTELAVKEATDSLRKIAEAHGISPQQLSDQFKGKRAAAPEPQDEAAPAPEVPAAQPEKTDAEKSAIEKELEKAVPGPEVPPIEEADDLFK